MTEAAQLRWRRCGAALVWGDDGEFRAVFDPESGDTHFLTELPVLLLDVIGLEPRSATELIDAVAGEAGLDDGAVAIVVDALQQLQEVRLVESVSTTDC